MKTSDLRVGCRALLVLVGLPWALIALSPACGETGEFIPGYFAPQGNKEGFTAKGEWMYIWPHDRLPETFSGYRIASTPVNDSLPNRGMSADHWGDPVVLEGNVRHTTIRVWCEREYVRNHTIEVGVETWGCWSAASGGFRALPFHEAPAMLASTKLNDAPVALLAFRMNWGLFRVQAESDDEERAIQAALEVANAIYRFQVKQHDAAATQPASHAARD